MRTSRRNLLATTSRRTYGLARIMRAPEGEGDAGGGGGGGNQQGGGGNQGENQQQQQGGGNQSNNTGQDFKPVAFWEDPKEPAPNSQNPQGGNQQQSGNQQQQQQGQGDDLATAIGKKVSGFTAPPVMTKETMEAIGTGDYAKFEEGLNTAIRGSMTETIGTVVNLMSKFGEHMEEKFSKLMESSHDTRDSRAFLREQIPASKNPEVQPIIDSLFDRALSLTKGDRPAAVSMTKRMMQAMAEQSAPDLNFRIAPIGSDSDPAPAAKKNWLEALNSPT